MTVYFAWYTAKIFGWFQHYHKFKWSKLTSLISNQTSQGVTADGLYKGDFLVFPYIKIYICI